ncbi:MAG TPA: hypothetical protein VGS78_01055 [Candidatus Sulfotelmatobacter sp.]|nr:hypothetical protein [Candidatus Sulfotelmatobacter sp.]
MTFTAPSSGASCTFPGGTTETDTTNSSGVATSSACTANSTAGAFTVMAATSGASSPADFSLTSVAVVTSANFVFYASGEDNGGGTGVNYYAIVGALTIDSNGNVLGGEEDYNDAFGITSPNEPTPDAIAAGGTLVLDPTTGLGTLTITSSNTNTGVSGLQTFAVQVVNPGHALITQFDGSAASSGSIDLQSATGITGGNFSFAMSGVDSGYNSWDFGGVFAPSTGAGIVDINDGGSVSVGNSFTSNSGTPDAFGRNVVSVSNPAINLATYTVGPEVMRMIDVDASDAAVGSAYGQGTGTFDNTSLTAGVFAEIGQWSMTYATAGQFATDTAGNITSGLADDNELDNGIQSFGNDISGSTYDLVSSGVNGYGSMTLANNNSISLLGVYMVDPALNINDPNNTVADMGGALIVDLSSSGVTPGGMGVITPQSDTTSTDFSGNYAAGFQDFNYFESVASCGDCEFDMVGPFTMASGGALSTASIGADDSDPLGTISGVESTGDTYGSTPLPVAAGYFTMLGSNGTPNPLNATIDGLSGSFDADIFQASATMLYWINVDATDTSVFLGTLQAQSSVAKARAAHGRTTRIQPQKKTTKTTFGAKLR